MIALIVLTNPPVDIAEPLASDRRESLRELPGIAVVIEPISREAEADALSTESVRTAVEFILRSSGTRLLPRSGTADTSSAPI